MPKRRVALCDVDNTLLKGQADFNTGLLQSLKKAGIKDIFLFTNMSLAGVTEKIADSRTMSRPELVNELKFQGFKVHAVITPADLAYNKGLGKAYEDIYLPQHNRIEKENLTENNYRDEQFIAAEKKFTELKNECNSEIAEKKGYVSEKSLMIEYFRENKPDWVESAVFFDDADAQVESVAQANNYYNEMQQDQMVLSAIQVDKNNFKRSYEQELAIHQKQLLNEKSENVAKTKTFFLVNNENIQQLEKKAEELISNLEKYKDIKNKISLNIRNGELDQAIANKTTLQDLTKTIKFFIKNKMYPLIAKYESEKLSNRIETTYLEKVYQAYRGGVFTFMIKNMDRDIEAIGKIIEKAKEENKNVSEGCSPSPRKRL